MSWLARDWAEETPVATPYERIILMALSSRANPDGTDAYPGRPRMARSAMCDIRTVQRHLNALLDRRVIAYGNQALVAHFPPDKRPVVYDILIPYSWYSPAQLQKVDRDRHERGLPPLRPEDRPDHPPPPEKPRRSDKGKPRPRKSTTDDDPWAGPPGGLTVTPPEPVDKSIRGDSQSDAGGLSDQHGVTLSPGRPDSETPKPFSDQPVLDPDPETQPPSAPNAGARDVPGARDGGEGSSGDDEGTDDRAKLAAGLLRTLLDQVGQGFPEPTHATKTELLLAVERAWAAGATSAQIRNRLSGKLAGIRDIGRVWLTRLTNLADELENRPAPPPPACGNCDARPGEGTHARRVWLDADRTRSQPCPNCHPAGRADVSDHQQTA